jgi:PAS domain S-box-containing protein
MGDERKTKKRLLTELERMRRKVAELEREGRGGEQGDHDPHRELAENLPGMVYRICLEKPYEMKFLNAMLHLMTGYDVEELTRGEVCSIEPLIVPEDRSRVVGIVKGALREKKPFEVGYRLRHKNGEIRHFLEKGRPVCGKDGDPEYIQGIILDQTAHKQMETALRESESKYRTLFESVPVGIALTTYQGRVLETNDLMLDMLGYGRDDLDQVKVQDVYCYPEDRERILTKAREDSHHTVRDFELKLKRKDGRTFYASVTMTLLNVGGEYTLLTVINDITKRKVAEEALRRLPSRILESQEEERKKIALEIHDGIGQTLSAIKYRVENALRLLSGQEALGVSQALEPIITTVQDAVEEIRRISMDLRPSSLSELGILATLSWHCRQFEATYSDIRIEKSLDIQEDNLSDTLRSVIYRITQEALNNIAKHSAATLIHFSLAQRGDRVELSIRDNGEGFNAESLLVNSRPDQLGLTGMKERAELSGGTFSIESEVGTGTTVRASWPLAVANRT